MDLSPNGYRIDISPHYLFLNPIMTVNGIDVQEQIIWVNHVLNLLVPEKLAPYEMYIFDDFLKDFIFKRWRLVIFIN